MIVIVVLFTRYDFFFKPFENRGWAARFGIPQYWFLKLKWTGLKTQENAEKRRVSHVYGESVVLC